MRRMRRTDGRWGEVIAGVGVCKLNWAPSPKRERGAQVGYGFQPHQSGRGSVVSRGVTGDVFRSD